MAFGHDFEAVNDDGVTIYYNIISSTDKMVEPQHHVLRDVFGIVRRKPVFPGCGNGVSPHFAGYMCKLFLCHSTYITKEQTEIKQEKATFF